MFLAGGSSMSMVPKEAERELGVRLSMREPCSVCADATAGDLRAGMTKALEWALDHSEHVEEGLQILRVRLLVPTKRQRLQAAAQKPALQDCCRP